MTLAAHNSEGRSYRSIREVLDLLTPEFPDVTISKIRFLESRGLIEPERTPSGYRKFFAADVDRLRWILKQQSEHFLPLKVIKGRLEQGALFEAELAAELSLFDAAETSTSPEQASEDAATEPVAPAPKLGGGGDEPPIDPESASAATPGASDVPEATPITEGIATTEVLPVPPVRERAVAAPKRPQNDVLYSVAEFIGATGATEELVAELVEFGLISTRLVRGSQTFGAEALEVTKLAAGFAEFGIEPRHLKSLRFAAERQALVYSQIVAPLARQRNAATRERAAADLANMAAMGAKLYEAFLNAVLRELA